MMSWNNCGDVEGESFIVLAANPAGESTPLIFFFINLMSEAIRRILRGAETLCPCACIGRARSAAGQ